MSNMLIGFIFGIGFAGWVYSKIYRSTGGNTQNAIIVAGVAGAFAMGLVVILLGIFT